uniref:Trafficking protein particle complex subunit 11 domain-containing protein n=2 Tax=Babesia bovis TaxID=5865 RepID=A7APP1_BABBO|eukprot:XP_001612093.1 hypothetical protein [Babesia bovis T2Bo]
MECVPSHFMTAPVPCAALSTHLLSHEKLKECILISGRNANDNQNRLNIVLSQTIDVNCDGEDLPQWQMPIASSGDWLLMQRNLSPCVVCVRDWQHFVVDGNYNSPRAEDSSVESCVSSSPNTPESFAKVDTVRHLNGNNRDELLYGDLKQLSDLIKSDVDRCIATYRRNLLDKSPVSGKIMFLILLREGTKNAQKAVNGLKNLNPSEVAAICVTSGEKDIESKVSKLETLIYDNCISYYERRIHMLQKTLSKVKHSTGSDVDETSEINTAMMYFKLAYFQQFIGNLKESVQCLSQAWNHVVPAAIVNPCEDYATVALYISLQLVSVHFLNSNIVDALTTAFEAGSFFKRILFKPDSEPLYHNICYLLYHSVALHLERANDYKELKENDHLKHHAANFGKWAIQHLLKLRISLMSGDYNSYPRKVFANLLFRGDDDFGHLYESFSEESNTGTVEQRLHNLESITEQLLVRLMDIVSTWSWYNSLLQVTELLGDSLLYSSSFDDAFFIYNNVAESLVNGTPLDAEYLLKRCSSLIIAESLKTTTTSRSARSMDSESDEESIQLPNYHRCAITMLLAERAHCRIWWFIYRRILIKILVSIDFILGVPLDIPSTLRSQGSIPSVIWQRLSNCEPRYLTGGLGYSIELDKRDYAMILLKGIMTLCSTGDVNVDFASLCHRLFMNSPLRDVTTSVLLSKYHTPFYMIGQVNRKEDSISTQLQLVVTFHVDLPFAIDINKVSICTSIGTFLFDIVKTVETPSQVELYIKASGCSEDAVSQGSDIQNSQEYDRYNEFQQDYPSNTSHIMGSMLQGEGDTTGFAEARHLEGDRRVILAITCPPVNNQFMINCFSLLGVKLHWIKPLYEGAFLDIACIIPSLVNQTAGITRLDEPLFEADSVKDTFRLLHNVGYVGSSSSFLKSEETLSMTMADPSSVALRSSMCETIMELTALSPIPYGLRDWDNSDTDTYSWGAYRMFVNRIYFKVFLGSIVEGHVAPVSCVLLYNKQIIGSDNLGRIRFSVDVSCSASSHIFYALCRDDASNCGIMRQCVNNQFVFSLNEFADAQSFEIAPRLDSLGVSEVDAVVPTLFADSPDFNCSINEDMNNFLELAKRDCNIGIVYIYGLLKVLSHGQTNVQFSLKMQPMLGHTLKAVESELLVVTDVSQIQVHEPISMALGEEHVYDSTNGSHIRMLNVQLVNKSPLQYDIDTVRLVYNDELDIENESLYGFCRLLEYYQELQFMHMCPESANSVEAQCIHSVVHPEAFPFDRLQTCFLDVITCNIVISNSKEAAEVHISIKHASTVFLGQPFEVIANITNTTSHTLDYIVSIKSRENKDGVFSIAGARVAEMIALPMSTRCVRWMLVPNK